MGIAPAVHPDPVLRRAPAQDRCQAYGALDPAPCGRPVTATVWVQCAADGPRERGVCADHRLLLEAGVVFRCRHCAGDLNLLGEDG